METGFSFLLCAVGQLSETGRSAAGFQMGGSPCAQAHALHLPNTGMACAIDLGEAYDIHPKNKQEVGKRLAQAALAKTYNKGTYEVPAFLGYRISGRTLILSFDQEVVAKEGAPKGFILAGPDGKYVPAQATIRGKEVILQSDRIEIPTAACYAWADNPVVIYMARAGFPYPRSAPENKYQP